MRARNAQGGVLAVAFVCAFLVATAWTQQGVRSREGEGRRRELAALAAGRQARAADFERELTSLRERVRALSSSQARGPLAALQSDIDALVAAAGTAPVRGPGIVVLLADSPLASSEGRASPDFVIQDVDLQLVVNQLWEAGAEAIAVNGQRIVSTTAIRSAGGAILVNFKVLTSPYRIEAVGNAPGMRAKFTASALARRFRGWVDLYRLRFEVGRPGELSLPAFNGSVRFRYAQPLGP